MAKNTMSSSAPKVSVIMSVYNGSCYLREAVDSILTQTFTNFDFVIINDCSTDDTWEILTDYTNRDSRIVLLNNEESIGLTKSLNRGLKVAKGEYIARQDADDISFPERLEKQVTYMDLNQSIAFISTGVQYINEEGNQGDIYIPPENLLLLNWYLLFRNPIRHSTVLWRRKLVSQEVGDYDPSFTYSQDYDLWVRIAEKLPIATLPLVLIKLRWHQKSITLTKLSAQDELSTAVALRQLQNYLSDQDLSIQDVANLRSMPRLKYEPQWQKYINLDSKEFWNSAFQYLELWKKYKICHQSFESLQDLQLLQEEFEKDFIALLKHCQNNRWLLIGSKLFTLYAVNFPRNSSLLIKIGLEKLVRTMIRLARHKNRKPLPSES